MRHWRLFVAALLVTILVVAGCGGGGGTDGTTPSPSDGVVTVTDNGDGTYSLFQGQTKLDTFRAEVYNWIRNGGTGWLAVARKGDTYTIFTDPELNAAGLAIRITGTTSSTYRYVYTLTVVDSSGATKEGYEDEGYQKWKLPEGSYTLTILVSVYDAANRPIVSSYQKTITIKAIQRAHYQGSATGG